MLYCLCQILVLLVERNESWIAFSSWARGVLWVYVLNRMVNFADYLFLLNREMHFEDAKIRLIEVHN